jgi:DNA-binding Lrp family transcriptional regulator
MDEMERKLVMLLQADGKKTLQELSMELGRPKTTIAARIKKLEN